MNITENDLFSQLGSVAKECYFAFNTTENKLVYLGEAVKSITGLNAAAIKANTERLWEIIHIEDRNYLRNALTTLLKTNRIQAEFRLTVAEKIKYVQLNAYSVGENLFAGHVADITDLKNNTFYAEKINARKNAMLGVLAHDLKEPVAVINMMASAIKSNPAVTGNKDILTNIKVIQELCDRNILLIKDLMNREFLESPEVGLRKERTNMTKAAADILLQYKNSESVVERDFLFTAGPDPVYATVDMFKIAQCINNLIVNAIKFTPVGGNVTVDVSENADSVQISVKDNGIGIPPELQPFLFDERTRAHRAGLRGEQGYGMGLSIIKTLVDFHGGRVWVESAEGKGSTFYLELPKGL